MPIIVKNNKKYGGTYSNATDINYDNSVSKLNADTSQEALDELANGLKNTSPVDNLLSTSTTLPLSANQGKVLDEKISTVNESLNNIGYTTNGLVLNKIQCVAGGYCKIGKLVVLNMRVKALENIAAYTTIIEGLPKPSGSDDVHVSIFGTDSGGITSLGKLSCNNDKTANAVFIINAFYICK